MDWIQNPANEAELLSCLRKNCCRLKLNVGVCVVRVGDGNHCIQFSICGAYFSPNSINEQQ